MSAEDTLPADAIELRVLHGPQAGARLPLLPGKSYTIGASDACMVVLVGAQVAQEHAQFKVDDNGIVIEPLQGQVLTLAGQALAPGPVPLGTVLQFGLVKLTAAVAGDDWPAEEELQVRNAPDAMPAESNGDADHDGDVPPQALSGPAAHSDGDPPSARRRGVRRFALHGAVILLVGAAAFAAVRQSSDATSDLAADGSSEEELHVKLVASAAEAEGGPNAQTQARAETDAKAETEAKVQAKAEADRASALAEAIKTFPPGTLHLKRAESGSWVVEGRLQTEAELQRLRERILAVNVPVEFKVTLEFERLEAVKRFVQAHRAPGRLELRVEPGSGKVLRIVGSASSADEAASFPEQARRELAAFEPIEMNILRPQQVRELFMDRLRDAGLLEKFNVVAMEPALELRASLSPQDTRLWETLFVDFTRLHGSTLKISAHVEPASSAIAAQVAAVVGGPFPYILTTGGQRITPGGALAGLTVVSVRDGEIALADGTRLRYGP